MSAPDVVVVGGGVVGCASAYALAREGVHVQLIEQHRVGAHASGGSAGILSAGHGATPFEQLGVASRELHSIYAPRLREETGIDVELQERGTLTLLEASDLAFGVPESSADMQVLDRRELHALEPALGERWEGAVFFPGDGQVNTGRLTRALAEGAARRGVRFSEGVTVTGFLDEGERVSGVRTTAGEVTAGMVVLAAGPWSSLLGSALGRRIPVFPVKGQIVWARTRPLALGRPVFALGCYLAPKYEMGIAIGATEERVGFDETPTLAGTAELIGMGVAICPELAGAELTRVWASLRPGSEDGVPILGPTPERPGIILATGHYRNGILLSLITAELVCNWVLERPQPVDVTAFRLDRFAGREVAARRG